MDAILNVWKPIGWTSFDVVKKIKGYVKPSKVGHAGTLDPFAEGVLVICIGKMTKKVESLMDHEKEYVATIQLGSETDTLDTEGKVVKEAEIPLLSDEKIEAILNTFLGESDQIPPMYSALKVNGKRLYKLAREGKVIERQPRKITINEIELLENNIDSLKIRVKCGRGTYIRVLASDIANAMDTVGFLKSLVRTQVGEFRQEDSILVENVAEWLSATA
ncbi:MAG: tRNA pseudouridine(55) synthase TruB [Candidatus Marinimicrobia bacterium]|nr:tRNA pseudouridine(55) synthase TruB [Candidatus Neomarinimicrobiota bacterium]